MFDLKLSYNEAIKIQEAQLIYYRNAIGRSGIKNIRRRTYCPIDLNPNEQIDIIKINELVPRGGCIEQLIKRHGIYNGLAHAMHDAIRNNKVYH